jgi:hypothetical protein
MAQLGISRATMHAKEVCKKWHPYAAVSFVSFATRKSMTHEICGHKVNVDVGNNTVMS